MQQRVTVPRDRLEIVELAGAAAGRPLRRRTCATDCRPRHKRFRRSISTMTLGSALFDAITHLPEYYLTRAETEILREWGWEIVRVLDEPVEFLELGSGSASKTRHLDRRGAARSADAALQPDRHFARRAARCRRPRWSRLIRDCACALTPAIILPCLQSGALAFERRVLAMLMGSNIGNYEPQRRARLDRVAFGARSAPGRRRAARRRSQERSQQH